MAWSMSNADFEEKLRTAGPRTEDDVTITWDGRRLDNRASLLSWLEEIAPILEELRERDEIFDPSSLGVPRT